MATLSRKHKDKDTQAYRQIDRQTGRKAGRQADRQTDKQVGKQATDRQIDRPTTDRYRQTDRKTYIQIQRMID
jgi:hypothetical protein